MGFRLLWQILCHDLAKLAPEGVRLLQTNGRMAKEASRSLASDPHAGFGPFGLCTCGVQSLMKDRARMDTDLVASRDYGHDHAWPNNGASRSQKVKGTLKADDSPMVGSCEPKWQDLRTLVASQLVWVPVIRTWRFDKSFKPRAECRPALRRPADVYLPAAGSPTADLAITGRC